MSDVTDPVDEVVEPQADEHKVGESPVFTSDPEPQHKPSEAQRKAARDAAKERKTNAEKAKKLNAEGQKALDEDAALLRRAKLMSAGHDHQLDAWHDSAEGRAFMEADKEEYGEDWDGDLGDQEDLEDE